MAKLLIIVTDKAHYSWMWESAKRFEPVDAPGNHIKCTRVGEDAAYLLAEFTSPASRQEDREREVRRQTTHLVLALSSQLAARCEQSGKPITEIHVAAHKGRIAWAQLERDAAVGALFKSHGEFVHGAVKPLNVALDRFLAAPSAETYDAVLGVLASRVPVFEDDGRRFLRPSDAFSRVRHGLVSALRNVTIYLESLAESSFDAEGRKLVAGTLSGQAGALLEDFRAEVYNAPDGLQAALEAITERSTAPQREAIERAWLKAQSFLPREGAVIYPPGDKAGADIGEVLREAETAEGLGRIGADGRARAFKDWYRSLDDALEEVRAAVAASVSGGEEGAVAAATHGTTG